MFDKFKEYVKNRCMGYYIDVADVKRKLSLVLAGKNNPLDQLGVSENTDKASVVIGHTTIKAGLDYLRHYDFMFRPFRHESFSLVEFGCFEGGSLRTWEQYFPNAEIYGVDIAEDAKRHEKGRVHVVIGDAAAQETYDTLKAKIGSAFIILDDASHAWSDMRRSFELFWDMLSPGGFYVVEDLVCGTTGAYSPPKILDAQPFFNYMQDRCEFLRWCVSWKPEANSYHFDHLPPQVQKIEREMDMCMFIPGAVIVRKKA